MKGYFNNCCIVQFCHNYKKGQTIYDNIFFNKLSMHKLVLKSAAV